VNVVAPVRPAFDAVRITHRLVGYDRATDQLAVEIDIPPLLETLCFKIAAVAYDDPGAVFSYCLNLQRLEILAFLLDLVVDPDRLEYFLEPGGPNPANASPERLEALVSLQKLMPRPEPRDGYGIPISEHELAIPTLRLLQAGGDGWMMISEIAARLARLFKPMCLATRPAGQHGSADCIGSVEAMIAHRAESTSIFGAGLAQYDPTLQSLRLTDLGRAVISGLRGP
jgi:hypothetical protein